VTKRDKAATQAAAEFAARWSRLTATLAATLSECDLSVPKMPAYSGIPDLRMSREDQAALERGEWQDGGVVPPAPPDAPVPSPAPSGGKLGYQAVRVELAVADLKTAGVRLYEYTLPELRRLIWDRIPPRPGSRPPSRQVVDRVLQRLFPTE
jgi:hypothetical protein